MYCEKFKSNTKSPPMRKPFRQNDIQWKANDRKQETERVFTRLVLFYIDRVKTDPTSKITCTHIQTHTHNILAYRNSHKMREMRGKVYFCYQRRWEKIHLCVEWWVLHLSNILSKKVNFRWTENEWKGFRLEMWS